LLVDALDVVPEGFAVVLVAVEVLINAHLSQVLEQDVSAAQLGVVCIHGAVGSVGEAVLALGLEVAFRACPGFVSWGHEDGIAEFLVDLCEVLQEIKSSVI